MVKQKQELLKRHNITVWRFHDYWHTHRPDGVGYGVLKKTGWLQYYKPDLLIVGEVHEWETAEYIRDARQLGAETALIVLGHSQSEEPGMEWLVDWLQPKLQGVPLTHIASGNPFRWS